MAASSASSRRATCSRCTRSVVRMNSTRQPFSNESQAERCRKMALAAAGRAEEQDIGALDRASRRRRRAP